jgi:hypothetical protein
MLVMGEFKKFVIQWILLFFSVSIQAQHVTNIRAEQRGQDIVVLYSLETTSLCEVSLLLSQDNGVTWSSPLKNVSGDVGKNISAGEKYITWKVLEEQEYLVGDKMKFKVIANGKWVDLPYSKGTFYSSDNDRKFNSVLINSKEYLIIDSLTQVFNGKDQLWFYFLTEKQQEINLVCPDDYAMIVIDKNQRIVLKWFWNSYSTEYEINGNCEPGVSRCNTRGVESVYLFLGSSGCGSGTSIQWARVQYENGMLTLQKMGDFGSGYSELILNELDGTYLIIEKIDPECHYDCPSRYKLSKYDLLTNTFMRSKETKLAYEDFSNLNQSDFLEIIKKAEPNAIP